MATIGVLALQGGFAAHLRALTAIGHSALPVREVRDLEQVQGLVLPGGESTAQLHLLERFALFAPLRAFVDSGRPVLATCAGLILLTRSVLNPQQRSLGLLDVAVRRNGWGRQVDSFAATSDEGRPLVFIRAPRLVEIGHNVEVRARLRGEPVMVRQGALTAATYHPELSGDLSLHREVFSA